jgi:hypothetical protein
MRDLQVRRPRFVESVLPRSVFSGSVLQVIHKTEEENYKPDGRVLLNRFRRGQCFLAPFSDALRAPARSGKASKALMSSTAPRGGRRCPSLPVFPGYGRVAPGVPVAADSWSRFYETVPAVTYGQLFKRTNYLHNVCKYRFIMSFQR